jgi:hypothetical protein
MLNSGVVQAGNLAKMGRAGTSEPTVQARQDAWLAVYRQSGNVSEACKGSGVGRSTSYNWIKANVAGFTAKFDTAKAEFCEGLESKAVEIARNTKAGQNPTVLLTLLAANLPEKYGRAGAVDPLAGEILSEIRKLSGGRVRQASRDQARTRAEGGQS